MIQAGLGITRGVAFDLQAVCSGFVFAVATADKFLISGSHKRALVIGAETFSRIMDWQDRTTCVLFGDGAGAMVLEAEESDGKSKTAACWPPICVRMAATARSFMSTAALRPPKPPAICAWRARKSSVSRSAGHRRDDRRLRRRRPDGAEDSTGSCPTRPTDASSTPRRKSSASLPRRSSAPYSCTATHPQPRFRSR